MYYSIIIGRKMTNKSEKKKDPVYFGVKKKKLSDKSRKERQLLTTNRIIRSISRDKIGKV